MAQKQISTLALALMLNGCGGGGGSSTPTTVSEPDQISGVALNPSSAVQSLYTYVGVRSDTSYRYQYSIGAPEMFKGITYQVQNILKLDANGNATSSKRYFTTNPFAIYTPDFSYRPAGYQSISDSRSVTRSLGTLPISAKIGDFGIYETATVKPYSGFGYYYATEQYTSSWTLTKQSSTTALFCYGSPNNPDLTDKACYTLDNKSALIQAPP